MGYAEDPSVLLFLPTSIYAGDAENLSITLTFHTSLQSSGHINLTCTSLCIPLEVLHIMRPQCDAEKNAHGMFATPDDSGEKWKLKTVCGACPSVTIAISSYLPSCLQNQHCRAHQHVLCSSRPRRPHTAKSILHAPRCHLWSAWRFRTTSRFFINSSKSSLLVELATYHFFLHSKRYFLCQRCIVVFVSDKL